MKSFENYLLGFTFLEPDALKTLIELFKPIQLKKNDFYATEGEYSKKIAFIESGVMRAFYQNPKGEEHNKLFFTTPAIVGAYSSLITANKNRINIQCLTDCMLFEANFQNILDLYDEYRSIETLNRKIAEDFFVKKERREMSLVMNDAKERYELFQQEFPELENLIPQYQIASYLGVTATQLSRIRAQRN